MTYALANKILSVSGVSAVDISSALLAESNLCERSSCHYLTALLDAGHIKRRPQHVLISPSPRFSSFVYIAVQSHLASYDFPEVDEYLLRDAAVFVQSIPFTHVGQIQPILNV